MKQLFFVLALTLISLGAQAENTPTGLLTNLLAHPEKCVITTPTPRFGWIPASSQSNNMQQAYEIELSRDNTFTQKLWQTGKVVSPQSLHILYSGTPLQPNTTYYWRVKTWDQSKNASTFSEPQMFHTGSFDANRQWPGQSRWIPLVSGRDTAWTFEDRHPISYHAVYPVKSLLNSNNRWFIDFRRAGFSNVKLTLKWDPKETTADTATLTIHLGEKAVGDSIDQKPGGGVIFRRYPLTIRRGTHTYSINLPRFVPKYPHSQAMPSFMPEVTPFRYCEIECGAWDVALVSAEQMRLHYEFDETTSSFSSSNPLLNDIYNLCRYSIIANTFNGDYAASERERMMYEADCYIHQMGHYAVDREYNIARYSLANMIYHATWPTEWISHILLMAWADYEQTGDDSFLRQYYHELKPKTLLALREKNGLISTLTGLQTEAFKKSIHFGGKCLVDIVDWPHGSMSNTLKGGETDGYDMVTVGKNETNPRAIYNTVVNAFHYRSLVLMSRIAGVVGNKQDERFYAGEAARVKKAFNQLLFDKSRGVYVDGVGSSHSSLHANMFPLAFGLVDKANRSSVLAYMQTKGMACGVYGSNYLMEALFDNGAEEYAFKLLTATTDRSWSNMLRVGATMTTEAWDNKYKSNNGWSHAWSSSPAHIIPRKIMGIEPAEPGFSRIRIQPRLCGVSQAEVKLPSIRGEITASMETDNQRFGYTFTTPVNTITDFVVPPQFSSAQITLDGKPVNTKKGRDGATIVSGIGSGTHAIECVQQ